MSADQPMFVVGAVNRPMSVVGVDYSMFVEMVPVLSMSAFPALHSTPLVVLGHLPEYHFHRITDQMHPSSQVLVVEQEMVAELEPILVQASVPEQMSVHIPPQQQVVVFPLHLDFYSPNLPKSIHIHLLQVELGRVLRERSRQ